MQLLYDLLDFLIAYSCPLCGKANSSNDICASCYSKLDFLVMACKKCQQPMNIYSNEINVCTKCVENHAFYNEMRAPLIYNAFLKQQILKFKNFNDVYLADLFAKMIYLASKDLLVQNSIIVPVPLFKGKLIKRGYNQSSFIAKSLSKYAGVIYLDDVILRVRDTNTQAGKTAKERVLNVDKAFVLNSKYDLRNSVIHVLDDIITTGATIFECARVVNLGHPRAVNLLCVGRRVI